ncbi:MAG TPA: YceI family protein [Thermoanaerobaculia bacterium]|nr:YceI family protein [Thermoanaerobaculia bacterium]
MSRLPLPPAATAALLLGLLPLAAACAPDPTADAPAARVEAAGAEPAPATGAAQEESVPYTFAAESKVEWAASKVTRSHDGGFEDVAGTIHLVAGDPARSSVDVLIDTRSIYSDTERLTGHLKSADFFEVETYPEARFTSTSITRQEVGAYSVTGDLTLHGVTRRLTFPATIAVADDTVTAEAEFSIRRFDWDIKYKGAADDLIRDDVLLRFDLVAHAAGGAAAEAPAAGGGAVEAAADAP